MIKGPKTNFGIPISFQKSFWSKALAPKNIISQKNCEWKKLGLEKIGPKKKLGRKEICIQKGCGPKNCSRHHLDTLQTTFRQPIDTFLTSSLYLQTPSRYLPGYKLGAGYYSCCCCCCSCDRGKLKSTPTPTN